MLRNAHAVGNENTVITAIAKVFREAQTCQSEEDLGRMSLAVAKQLTGSRCGFIGVIDHYSGKLECVAKSDSGRVFCQAPSQGGHAQETCFRLESHDLCSRALQKGKGLFANDLPNRSEVCCAAQGNEPLQSLLGLPLIYAGKTFGMLGLGNREGGYGPPDLEMLEGLAPAILQVFVNKRADTALRRALLESETRYRTLLEALPVAAYMCDAQGRITGFNEKALGLWGLRPEIGDEDRRFCGSFRLWRPDGTKLPHEQTPMAQAILTGASSRNQEVVIERPDGCRLEVLVNIDPLRDADGHIIGAINILIDIRERKRAEDALRQSEARFRQLADSMPQLVWTADPDGSVDYYNQRVTNFDGFLQSPDGLWKWQLVLHPDDVEPTVVAWQAAVASGDSYQCEHRVRMADSSMRWHLSRGVPVFDETGCIVKWYGTATDIHDLKQAQQAQQETDRRKDEFLATLAHELRNPLAPIRNAVEVLKLKGPPEPVLQSARDTIERQVAHMVRLIDDLLDVSRITWGKLQLRLERVDLAEVLAQALEASRPFAEYAGHNLAVDLPTYPIPLDADLVRLAQVFSNLLNNACKYTDAGGRIHLGAECVGKQVAVTVEDTGIGIPPDHLPRVFEMFSQVSADTGRSQTGLGIGLSLACSLVEMHGGHIEARSEGLGKGSVFTVWLPLATTCLPQAAAGTQLMEDRPAATARILVVDDKEDVVESLALLLLLYGHEVRTARDGLEAIEVAAHFRPDLVLLDIGMPGLDGYGACEHMRLQPWGKEMMIVAMTGWGQERDRRRTEAAGFDGHLVKPVDPAAILRLLAQMQAAQL
jgi:PAS domain S-box-containing protein